LLIARSWWQMAKRMVEKANEHEVYDPNTGIGKTKFVRTISSRLYTERGA
jgi:hypothetical protein